MSPHQDTPGTGTSPPRPSPPPAARPGPPSRAWGISGAIVAVLIGVAVIWWYSRDAGERISATTIGYQVVDDRSVVVTFDVTRPLQQPVTCTITAQDEHFATVGSAQVVIPTGTARTTHHVATVRTAALAVTGNVTDCVRTP